MTIVRLLLIFAAIIISILGPGSVPGQAAGLEVGFGEADITPSLTAGKPVYLAGFGQNRTATRIHDPLMARVVVLRDGERIIALASVDLVGLFLPSIERIRQQLPEFTYVLVSSTHNHNGPDTLGLWGPRLGVSGVDPQYLKSVEAKVVQAIRDAAKGRKPVAARIGTIPVPELLHDGREPYVLHDELVALAFHGAQDRKPVGIVVQWNCHPETLGGKNPEATADYVGYTCKHLSEKHRCPVVYLTGTVGGLMTSLQVKVKDEKGRELPQDSWEKTERLGKLLGEAADRALASGQPVTLTPFDVRRRGVYLPLDNAGFRLMRQLGVLDRPAFLWAGDPYRAEKAAGGDAGKPLCFRTEVGLLRLGELDVAAIPGEIYPELVLGKVQDPVDPGADFPDAPIEPSIYGQMRGKHKMIIGLANDEVGYILPKRQWDVKPPFCYGRKKEQYGEINSVGPETGPILCRAFQELARERK